jgi:phage protein D
MALNADDLYKAPPLDANGRIAALPAAPSIASIRSDAFANNLSAPRRLRASASVFLGGQDVTDRFDPHLISISVTDKLSGIDEASIELDDRYGRIELPSDNLPLQIRFGWPGEGSFTSFNGRVSDIESYAQKRSGRRLKLSAQGLDVFQSGKAQRSQIWGDGIEEGKTFGEVVNELAGAAGWGKVTIDPKLASKQRKVWAMTNESPMNFIFRSVKELGGTLKVADDKWSIMAGDSTSDASGNALPTILAQVGKNVLAWRIKPMTGRPQWAKTSAHWFDPAKSKWMYAKSEVRAGERFGSAIANFLHPAPMADKDHAQAAADGSAAQSFNARGTGWVVIDGEPQATSGGSLVLSGARPGVDNSYRLEEVEQTYHRGGGFTTRAQVDSLGTTVPITGNVPTTDLK